MYSHSWLATARPTRWYNSDIKIKEKKTFFLYYEYYKEIVVLVAAGINIPRNPDQEKRLDDGWMILTC